MSNCYWTPIGCSNGKIVENSNCPPYKRKTNIDYPPCKYIPRCESQKLIYVQDSSSPEYNYCLQTTSNDKSATTSTNKPGFTIKPVVPTPPSLNICNSCQGRNNCFYACNNNQTYYFDNNGNPIQMITPVPICSQNCNPTKKKIILDADNRSFQSRFSCIPITPTPKPTLMKLIPVPTSIDTKNLLNLRDLSAPLPTQ